MTGIWLLLYSIYGPLTVEAIAHLFSCYVHEEGGPPTPGPGTWHPSLGTRKLRGCLVPQAPKWHWCAPSFLKLPFSRVHIPSILKQDNEQEPRGARMLWCLCVYRKDVTIELDSEISVDVRLNMSSYSVFHSGRRTSPLEVGSQAGPSKCEQIVKAGSEVAWKDASSCPPCLYPRLGMNFCLKLFCAWRCPVPTKDLELGLQQTQLMPTSPVPCPASPEQSRCQAPEAG